VQSKCELASKQTSDGGKRACQGSDAQVTQSRGYNGRAQCLKDTQISRKIKINYVVVFILIKSEN